MSITSTMLPSAHIGLSEADWRPTQREVESIKSLTLTESQSDQVRLAKRYRVPFGTDELVVSLGDSPAPWLQSVFDSIQPLMRLGPNWDSYGAPPIDPVRVFRAVQLLISIMQQDTPAPAIVPTSSGGVQMEWHMRDMDIEVAVESANRFWAFMNDHRTGTQWDIEFAPPRLGRLRDAIKELTRRV